jgi:hypothetical protein
MPYGKTRRVVGDFEQLTQRLWQAPGIASHEVGESTKIPFFTDRTQAEGEYQAPLPAQSIARPRQCNQQWFRSSNGYWLQPGGDGR